ANDSGRARPGFISEPAGGCAFHLFVGSASRRAPQVFMMQSTDARHLHHPPLARQLHAARLGCVFSQGLLLLSPGSHSPLARSHSRWQRELVTTEGVPVEG